MVFLLLKLFLLTTVTGDVKITNHRLYSTVVDRLEGGLATVLIEEIGVQCTIPIEQLDNRLGSFGQDWVNILYDETNDSCKFLSYDAMKTKRRKQHILQQHEKIQKNQLKND